MTQTPSHTQPFAAFTTLFHNTDMLSSTHLLPPHRLPAHIPTPPSLPYINTTSSLMAHTAAFLQKWSRRIVSPPFWKKKKQQIPFDFLLPQSVVWLCIMSVGVCLVLLALSCLPAASPTECEELTKPLEDQSQVGCPRLHIGKLRNKQRTNSVA